MTAPDGKKRLTAVADTEQALMHKQQQLRVVTKESHPLGGSLLVLLIFAEQNSGPPTAAL